MAMQPPYIPPTGYNPPVMRDFEFYDGWVPKPEADRLMDCCIREIPWGKKRWSLFYTLPQLAYYYTTEERRNRPMPICEELISVIERGFNTTCSEMWCNLFQDGNHHIEWHQDQYGEQCFVLSFGASRAIDWRDKKTKQMLPPTMTKHGDLYYFNQQWDKTHEHRVPKDENCKTTRLSFVVFTQPPFSGRYPH